MFKFEEICELIRLVGSTRVAGVEVEHAGSRLRIDGALGATKVETQPAESSDSVTVASAETAASAASVEAVAASDDDQVHYVISPIVGTFYRAPNPDADPYVKVGDIVGEGQTLCIVEAMKLMNEIESDVEGTVVKVLPENSEAVEYAQRLFAIRQA